MSPFILSKTQGVSVGTVVSITFSKLGCDGAYGECSLSFENASGTSGKAIYKLKQPKKSQWYIKTVVVGGAEIDASAGRAEITITGDGTTTDVDVVLALRTYKPSINTP